jgi:hypothetical protein
MPRSPTYAQQYQLVAFREWLSAELAKRTVSKSRLAAALQYDSIQHVNKILRGTPPMPATLYKLCVAAEIPWLAAFAMAGYYGEILSALARLERLSNAWRREDGVDPSLDDEAQFRSIGAIRIGGQIALSDEAHRKRYHVGLWREDHLDVDTSELPEESRRTIEARLKRPVVVVVPKPLAAAILISVTGFPRRGDIWKEGASNYAAHLLEKITPLIDFTPGGSRRSLPPLLKAADDALRNRVVPLDARRVIASEYIVAWADSLCQPYTHFARLASFEYFGVAGSSWPRPSVEIQLPQLRRASLPAISEFTTQFN